VSPGQKTAYVRVPAYVIERFLARFCTLYGGSFYVSSMGIRRDLKKYTLTRGLRCIEVRCREVLLYSENPQGMFTKFCNFIYCCEKEMLSRQLRVSFRTFYAVSDGYKEPSQK
jgi:hypothetical protein